MSHSVKLLIAIGLAVLAAIMNFAAVSSSTKPVKFVSLNEARRAGETITTDVMSAVDVPAQYADDLKQSIVPWNEMAILSGKRLSRDVEAGELLLWEDAPVRGPRYDLREGETAVFINVSDSSVSTVTVGESISFRFPGEDSEQTMQWVGPFRVVTVGDKRVRGESEDRVTELSVAMPEVTTDARFELLQTYIDRVSAGEDLPLLIRAHIDR